MSQRPFVTAFLIGGYSLALLLGTWGCTSLLGRPSKSPPTATSPVPPPSAPVEPIPAPQPETSAPRAPSISRPQPTPTMVASAQWVQEGIRAIEAGDYNRATTLLERAIGVEPNNGQAFYYYGVAMGERGNPKAALNFLRKAEILLRGDRQGLGDVYTQMGVNEERLGRRQEASQRYEQALAQNPDQALARRRLQALDHNVRPR